MKSQRIFIALLALVAIATSAFGQTLDRSKAPVPGKPRDLVVPKWVELPLDNGALLVVSEQHNLPLVSISVNFVGGANQFEPSGKRGLASITMAMLTEGTKTRTGDQLSDALQLLGTNIQAQVGSEQGSIGFTSTTARFEATLAILAEVMSTPSFPAEALERLRGRTLIGLAQSKDQPEAISALAFNKILYGEGHPFGQRQTEASTKAITRDDVMKFHEDYFKPGRAIITVVGDVKALAVKALLAKVFKDWKKAGEKPNFTYPALPEKQATAIYLVDKPGAAQSIFALGLPGPSRNTPDYFAIMVMNHILGGHFQSRLNYNIREQHGYSYGVNSGFAFGRGPGAFRAGGAIVSNKTDAALIEFMKELKGIEGEKPVIDDELKTAKESLIQGLPRRFGSVGATSASITDLIVQGLPRDYYQNFARNVNAVTREDLLRVARQYVDLNHFNIVIVGDRASVEEPLKATGIAPVKVLDTEGNPAGSKGSR